MTDLVATVQSIIFSHYCKPKRVQKQWDIVWHGETSKKNPMKSSSSCRLFGSHSRQVLAWHHSNLLFQDLSQAGSWAVCPFDLTCQGATSHNQLANDRDRQGGACEPCLKKWIAYHHWTTANVQSFPGDQQKICCEFYRFQIGLCGMILQVMSIDDSLKLHHLRIHHNVQTSDS